MAQDKLYIIRDTNTLPTINKRHIPPLWKQISWRSMAKYSNSPGSDGGPATLEYSQIAVYATIRSTVCSKKTCCDRAHILSKRREIERMEALLEKREIERITTELELEKPRQNFVETNQEPKIYCPDCGSELQARIHQQMVEPFQSYLYFYCIGQCHVKTCTMLGMEPERAPYGTPKFGVDLEQGSLIDINEIIAREAVREAAAIEIMKIYGNSPCDFAPHNIIMNVFDRTRKKYKSTQFALDAIYVMGWVYGIRAERKRRKEAAVKAVRLEGTAL